MMNLVPKIKTSEYLMTNTDEVINQIEINKSPFVITKNGEAKAVLMDISSYQDLINSINLMKLISIGEKDYNSCRYITNDELDNRINSILS